MDTNGTSVAPLSSTPVLEESPFIPVYPINKVLIRERMRDKNIAHFECLLRSYFWLVLIAPTRGWMAER